MTPRDQLLRALGGQPTEGTPVWLLFPYHATSYYADVRRHPAYRRVFDASLEQGVIMLDRRHLRASLFARDVVHRREEVAAGSRTVTRDVLSHGGGEAFSESPHTPEGAGKKLVASDADLEFFCGLPIELDPARVEAELAAQLAAYDEERAEFPLDRGAMMLDLGSPVNRLYFAANLEEYAVWSVTHSALVEAHLTRVMEHLRLVYRFCLERDLADVYFLVGSELAAPPLVSRETFRRWVVPFDRALIDLVHAYGKRVIQHFHGQIREVLPDFAAMGPDGLHTIEAPPVGNCTLSEAFDATRGGITLIGNIQYDDFRSLEPEAMRRLVHATLDEAGPRRFILSPTAGPYEAEPSGRLIENYLAFIRAARERDAAAPRPTPSAGRGAARRSP